MVEQRIDKRPGIVSMGRVCHHSSRLVYNQQVIIFEKDIEGDVFRSGFLWRGFGKGNLNDFTWTNEVTGSRGAAIDENQSLLYAALDPVPGRVLNVMNKKEIEPFLFLSGGNNNGCFRRHCS
jgi:hypothetical protein